MTEPQRVIIASNRLPLLLNSSAPGSAAAVNTVVPASGGLATGLRVFHETGDSIWIGWSGEPRRDGHADAAVTAEMARRRIVPVALSRMTARRYYDGMCNAVLWPLFHSHTERAPIAASSDWDAYREANDRFAAAIAREHRPGDLIWVHDYHLLLVPRILRTLIGDAPVGLFLHVPFPSPDVFRTIPWRRELLDGMAAATVVGFHTAAYANHFLEATHALLPRPTASGGEPRVGVYPMGVDVASFSGPRAAPAGRGVEDAVQVMLGVDRLDYTKGIPQRLLAYGRLLRNRPDLRGRVRLVQLAVPSRERVGSYKTLRRQVEELVGRINGEHGTAEWTPVRYIRRSISRDELVALYRRADVMLVTPLRDGMNLVAKEFVAARGDGDGVLVLSEFAGAAEQLRSALTVNPYSEEQMASTMAAALELDRTDRRRRMAALRARVIEQDVHWWAERVLADLRRASAPQPVAETVRSRSFWPFAMVKARLAPRGREAAKNGAEARPAGSYVQTPLA